MATLFKKTREQSGTRVYTKIVNGNKTPSDEAEFNSISNKRLKQYSCTYKIKTGDLSNKKIIYIQKYKYKDTATDSTKHRPKFPTTTIKGGWGVTDAQAADIYNNNPTSTVRKMETEIWMVFSDQFNIPSSWTEPRGPFQYGGKIDPPGGHPVVLKKSREGINTEDREYKKIIDGTQTDSNIGEFDNSKKRVVMYTCVYRIKSGSLINKKITVKKEWKFKDTVNGKQKHRPKIPKITIKGGWGVTDAQAADLYGNNLNKLAVKSQSELWETLPDTFTIPEWYYSHTGFSPYGGVIDPPAGFQVPYGDSDVFEIIGTRNYQEDIPTTDLNGRHHGAVFNRVWVMFDTSPGHICSLLPDAAAVEAAGFSIATQAPIEQQTVWRIYDPINTAIKGPGNQRWNEFGHIAVPEYYDAGWGPGWYNMQNYSSGYYHLGEEGKGGPIYRTILSGETLTVDEEETYADDAFAPGVLKKWTHGFIPGQDLIDELENGFPTPGLMIETRLNYPVEQHMKDWKDLKITTPFKAHSVCGIKNLYPEAYEKWYYNPEETYPGDFHTVVKLDSSGELIDVCELDEPYPWKDSFPYNA